MENGTSTIIDSFVDDPFIAITLIINTAALLFVIYQTWLANQSLAATRKSIDDAKIQRQLEVLPEAFYVIHVRVNLENWKKDLIEKRDKLELAIKNNDDDILRELSEIHIKNPGDLDLSRFLFDKMPAWLGQIWISGAQYYYNATASFQELWGRGGGQYSLAKALIVQCVESEKSISVLLGYIKDMVPFVILDTPASLSNDKFFRN